MASARCVECGADSGAGNVFCTACWLKRLRRIEKVGEPVRLGYGARWSVGMAEIWMSRKQVEWLLPVICRIGALLREADGHGFWMTFAAGMGE